MRSIQLFLVCIVFLISLTAVNASAEIVCIGSTRDTLSTGVGPLPAPKEVQLKPGVSRLEACIGLYCFDVFTTESEGQIVPSSMVINYNNEEILATIGPDLTEAGFKAHKKAKLTLLGGDPYIEATLNCKEK
jgi:hypothetical protein